MMKPTRRTIVACTARAGSGIRRGPDRMDHHGPISSFIIDTASDAAKLLSELDSADSEIYIDVERKKPLDLMMIARETLTRAHIRPYKPNDTTVDAADATVLAHFGPDLTGLRCGVFGAGNLGFKIALRLAERSARVEMAGRDQNKIDQVISTLNMVLPHSAPHPVSHWTDQPMDVLVSAVTANGVLNQTHARQMRSGGLAIDAGINNFAPEFLTTAHAAGCDVLRLDVRAAMFTLHREEDFFHAVAGRTTVAGVTVVAGGIIGRSGEIVVDRKQGPSRVIGVADGLGGLIDQANWTEQHTEEVQLLNAFFNDAKASH